MRFRWIVFLLALALSVTEDAQARGCRQRGRRAATSESVSSCRSCGSSAGSVPQAPSAGCFGGVCRSH